MNPDFNYIYVTKEKSKIFRKVIRFIGGTCSI